jgi:hypothetical protein
VSPWRLLCQIRLEYRVFLMSSRECGCSGVAREGK